MNKPFIFLEVTTLKDWDPCVVACSDISNSMDEIKDRMNAIILSFGQIAPIHLSLSCTGIGSILLSFLSWSCSFTVYKKIEWSNKMWLRAECLCKALNIFQRYLQIWHTLCHSHSFLFCYSIYTKTESHSRVFLGNARAMSGRNRESWSSR